MARNSSTMLDRGHEGEYPGIVPYLRGKTFKLSSMSKMLAVDFPYKAFIMLRYVLYITVL